MKRLFRRKITALASTFALMFTQVSETRAEFEPTAIGASFRVPALNDSPRVVRGFPKVPFAPIPKLRSFKPGETIARTRPLPVAFANRSLGQPVAGVPVVHSIAETAFALAPKKNGEARHSFGVRNRGASQARSQLSARKAIVSVSTSSPIGIESWWAMLGAKLPGVGKYFVNAWNGNLVIQSTDMALRNAGVPLVFARTYNSQSLHDVNNDDNSNASLYGNGWTSSTDSRIVDNTITVNGENGVSIFDFDGKRIDFTPDASISGQYDPPTGIHEVVKSSNNFFYRYLPAGQVVVYYSPDYAAVAPNFGALSGRLYGMLGRNYNTYTFLQYSFVNGNAAAGGLVSGIKLTTQSGQSASLVFTSISGHQLLSSLTFPDTTTSLQYGYDSNGNLTQVQRPGNNSANQLSEAYGYSAISSSAPGSYAVRYVSSPRYVTDGASDGGVVLFDINAADQVGGVDYLGTVNPTFSTTSSIYNDGVTNGTLQPAIASGQQFYRSLTFSFTSAQGGVVVTNESDTDGHQRQVSLDAVGRPVQLTAATGGTTLATDYVWDANNNVVSEIESRGAASGGNPQEYEADIAYNLNGDQIAVALPASSPGLARPTRWASYDSVHNLLSYCDANWSQNNGHNWTATPSPDASPCPTTAGGDHATYSYTQTSSDPSGELTSITDPATDLAPSGYRYSITYSAAFQNSIDLGQPTLVSGDQISARAGGGTITPAIAASYNVYGDLVCYNHLGSNATASATGPGSSVISYDSNNRVLTVADPDDNSVPGCGKTGSGSKQIVYTRSLYPDGNIHTTQTPAEAALNTSTSYNYDADGDTTSITEHHGCVTLGCPGTNASSRSFYDADDRLIEVVAPADASDAYTPWAERYYYDLTNNGTVTVAAPSGSTESYTAHGNLFSIQLFLPTNSGSTQTGWHDYEGFSYDALDRETGSFSVETGANGWQASVLNYDSGASTLGFLASSEDANGNLTQYAYDPGESLTAITHSGGSTQTGSRTIAYDMNGSPTQEQFGNLIQTYGYDKAGNLTSESDPAGGSLTSPATYRFTYFGNDAKATTSVTSSALSINNMFSYFYEPGGEVSQVTATLPNGVQESPSWTYSLADRVMGYSVPGLGSGCCVVSYDNYGRLSTEQVPVSSSQQSIGYFTYQKYDAEGAQTQTQAYNVGPNYSNVVVSRQLNARGELISESAQPNTQYVPPEQYHGFAGEMIPDSSNSSSNGVVPSSETFDVLNGAHKTATYADLNGSPAVDSWSYDADGNQLMRLRNISSGLNTISKSSKFDAEGELIASTVNYAIRGRSYRNTSLTYTWSPSGNVVVAAGDDTRNNISGYSPTSNETLHWADGQLIFTTNANGALDDLKIGSLGDYTVASNPNVQGGTHGVTFWGRDVDGNQASSYGAVTANFLPPGDPILGFGLSAPDQAGIMPIQEPRADGFTDLNWQFQGARVYDYAGNQWLSPDPSVLDTRNLNSLRPYSYLDNTASGTDTSGNSSDGSCDSNYCFQQDPNPPSGISISPAVGVGIVGAIISGIGNVLGGLFSGIGSLFGGGGSHVAPAPPQLEPQPFDNSGYAAMREEFAFDESFASGVETVESLVVLGPEAGPEVEAAEGGLEASTSVLEGANYAQKTFSATFSTRGSFAGKAVSDIVAALRSGELAPSQVEINYIVRDNQVLILNTRSAQALEQAGFPRSSWTAIDRTGDQEFEGYLSDQLRRNKLTNIGTSTTRPSDPK